MVVRDEMDIAPAWARAIQAEPKLWLRAQPGQGGNLCEKLGDARLAGDAFPDAVVYHGEQDLFQSDEFHAGEFEIQDIASQAVGWLCAPKPGEKWWDTCAGEGGKTLHLSALMQNKGLIWASDRAAWRLLSLKRRAARAKVFNFRVRPPGMAAPSRQRKQSSTAYWWMPRAAVWVPGSAIPMPVGRQPCRTCKNWLKSSRTSSPTPRLV